MKIPIALVEDNPSLRKRFVEHFKYFQNISLDLVASTGEEFLNKIQLIDADLRPQVILMDIEMPGISGIEATRRLKELFPEIDVIILTVFEDEEKIFQAIQAGAVGYLLKDEPPTNILSAIIELKEGGAPMSAIIARKIIKLMRMPPQPIESAVATPEAENEFGLSERELKIVEFLVAGYNYNVISEKLFISPHTVKSHIKNIYKKMHVHSRASAVSTAIKKKLVR